MPDVSLTRLQCGVEEVPPRIPLRAGPLSVQFSNGDLWYLRYGDHEVLHRVYVAVRDPRWVTVPIALQDLAVSDNGDSFQVGFTAVHRDREIHFEWQGELEGATDGTIVFRMSGVARSTFLRNRIGICVLHPIDECAGQPCVVMRTDGTVEEGTFPRLISPHQPFKTIREIQHQVAPGVRARVSFSGEVFEMEDQRNWTDLSFKTYSTPLEMPMPIEIQSGTRIEQSISLRLSGAPVVPTRTQAMKTFTILTEAVPMPRIGLGMSSINVSLDETALQKLALLKPAHLRVDLRLPGPEAEDRLASADAQAARFGAALEVALFLPPSGGDQLEQVLHLLWRCPVRINSVLLFNAAGFPAPSDDLAKVRRALALSPMPPAIGTGAAGNFADLNRNRPIPADVDFYCYSANPQVHASDNATIVENLRGLRQTVETATSFAGGRPLVISPITIRSRRKAAAPPAAAGGPRNGPPSDADLRQISVFGAGWTACSLGYAAGEGVRSLTYYETAGWAGVLEPAAGTAGMSSCGLTPGSVFPLYHVLADFAEMAGGRVVRTRSSDPLSFDGVALANARRVCVIVSSWLNERQSIRIDGITGRPLLRRLYAGTVLQATSDPTAYRSVPPAELPRNGFASTIELEPFEVARIDWLRSASTRRHCAPEMISAVS